MSLAIAFQQVAPYYNMALVFVVFILFGRLFLIKKRDSFLLPWKIFCGAVGVYVIVQVLTILKFAGIVSCPLYINGILEFFMVSMFIYVLLVQKDHIAIKQGKKPHRIKMHHIKPKIKKKKKR